MSNSEAYPSSKYSYIFVGVAYPLLPSFLCFWILAAANLSVDPWLRILLLTASTCLIGGIIGYIAYKLGSRLTATWISALFGPVIGYIVGSI